MKFSIYLHKPIADILTCYGDLSDVVNKILSLVDEDIISIFNKPAAPDRQGAGRYEVDVTNESYLEIIKSYPVNSSQISLRRLLYWFVENEIYYEVGWKPVRMYVNKDKERELKRIQAAYDNVERVRLKTSYTTLCDEILEKLNTLKEVIKNG